MKPYKSYYVPVKGETYDLSRWPIVSRRGKEYVFLGLLHKAETKPVLVGLDNTPTGFDHTCGRYIWEDHSVIFPVFSVLPIPKDMERGFWVDFDGLTAFSRGQTIPEAALRVAAYLRPGRSHNLTVRDFNDKLPVAWITVHWQLNIVPPPPKDDGSGDQQ